MEGGGCRWQREPQRGGRGAESSKNALVNEHQPGAGCHRAALAITRSPDPPGAVAESRGPQGGRCGISAQQHRVRCWQSPCAVLNPGGGAACVPPDPPLLLVPRTRPPSVCPVGLGGASMTTNPRAGQGWGGCGSCHPLPQGPWVPVAQHGLTLVWAGTRDEPPRAKALSKRYLLGQC